MPKYHSLLSREKSTTKGTVDRWSIEFGDYSYRVVLDEMRECKDAAEGRLEFKIITTGDKQDDIKTEVARLNELRV